MANVRSANIMWNDFNMMLAIKWDGDAFLLNNFWDERKFKISHRNFVLLDRVSVWYFLFSSFYQDLFNFGNFPKWMRNIRLLICTKMINILQLTMKSTCGMLPSHFSRQLIFSGQIECANSRVMWIQSNRKNRHLHFKMEMDARIPWLCAIVLSSLEENNNNNNKKRRNNVAISKGPSSLWLFRSFTPLKTKLQNVWYERDTAQTHAI